jgi:hypothetical protein
VAQLAYDTKSSPSPFLPQQEDSQRPFLEHIGLCCSIVIFWRMFHSEYSDYPFVSEALMLSVMSVQRRRNESVMSIVMKVRLSSSSLFLPEEVAVNAMLFLLTFNKSLW